MRVVGEVSGREGKEFALKNQQQKEKNKREDRGSVLIELGRELELN